MQDVQNRVAVVTGAASGIGLGIVRALTGAGVHVAMLDIEEQALTEARAQFGTANVDVQPFVCDVGDRAQVRDVADAVRDHYGRVDIVCNNAGVAAGGAIDETSDDDWDWVLGVNLHGVVNGMRAYVPLIKAGGRGGHVVNTASILGLRTGPRMAIYAASKYAVVAISEAAREDLAPFDIGVSALCPGMIDTRILRSDRNRPTALPERSTGMFGDEERQEVEGRFATEGLDPNVVGEQVLDGIRKDKPFIFTHASLEDGIRERMDRILGCFDGVEV
ncbi:MAG: SDR family NAD(P)-dependent oxidoreductase [Gammaproteobacteria bacterium]|nr:SDR family NAD(P)-dependent oxidoreductase [Gammaproteobacteria bacterium]